MTMSGRSAKNEASLAARIEGELRQDLYQAIFNHSREPIAIIDHQGRYLEQNAAHVELLGYSDEDLRNLTPAIHMGEEGFAAVVREVAEKGEYRGEVSSRTKAGEVKHIELSAFAMRAKSGETLCYVGIKHDITERRRTESRLALQYAVTRILAESLEISESAQQILQAACHTLDWTVGALWKVDSIDAVVRCIEICHNDSHSTPEFDQLTHNSAFKKGVGLPGRIWETGKPLWIDNVVKDENFPRAPVALREDLRGAFGFPILIGTEVWGVFEFLSPEIREPDDALMRLVGGLGGQIGQFAQRRRAEEELARLFERESLARAEAERANGLKDEFLATLSHELRTPLNAVIGWSRMLGSDRLDRESSKHALEVIERNAWAQKQMIEDILDVSRVITGKLQLNLSPTNLVSVIEAALDSVRPALEAKEITVETVLEPSLRMISGDADRLQQVVWNVLSNAAKFTPLGGRIEISATQSATHVLIAIRDSGPGVDPDFLPHVFERFRQADGSTTRTHGGLGIGLAISRHLIELHGGTIAVENSAAGQGANFTIRLPLPTGVLHKEILDQAAATFAPSGVEEMALDGLRILTVDDESDTLELIRVELAHHGAQVTSVTSAEDALAAFQNHSFDVLVSDIGMPKMDGYELIRRIRLLEEGKGNRIPAIALTAYARIQDRVRAMIAGFSIQVVKPFQANELVTAVASLTNRLSKSS
jgi:PAS domain S-box-containing protein